MLFTLFLTVCNAPRDKVLEFPKLGQKSPVPRSRYAFVMLKPKVISQVLQQSMHNGVKASLYDGHFQHMKEKKEIETVLALGF